MKITYVITYEIMKLHMKLHMKSHMKLHMKHENYMQITYEIITYEINYI